MSAPTGPSALPGSVRGGDAWVVPFEPGGAVWVTASAPAITVLDLRAPKPSPAELARPAALAAR